jgi:hypothetical protein
MYSVIIAVGRVPKGIVVCEELPIKEVKHHYEVV